jgi:hypothetical protein
VDVVLGTTSSILGHYAKLEEPLTRLYGRLAEGERSTELNAVLSDYVKEGRRQREAVERAYREAVTDAYSVGFLPEPVDEAEYRIKDDLPESPSRGDLIKATAALEETTVKFLNRAAGSVRSQLPEVAQAMVVAARRGSRRLDTLRSMPSK